MVIIIGIPDHRNLARARKIFCFFRSDEIILHQPQRKPFRER
jgi:hypothetical protein